MSIDLTKGQRISLEKNNNALTRIEVGVNWGAITKKGFLGVKTIAVDLDASVGMFDERGNLVDEVYFAKLVSKCHSITHSGDDREGDSGGDDGLDNEVVTIDLPRVPQNVHHLALVLNSYKKQDFAEIPHANIRIHDSKAAGSASVFAKFDVANDPTFAGKVSMVLGDVYRHGENWKFRSIGEAITAPDLRGTLATFAKQYLN